MELKIYVCLTLFCKYVLSSKAVTILACSSGFLYVLNWLIPMQKDVNLFVKSWSFACGLCRWEGEKEEELKGQYILSDIPHKPVVF